MEVHHAKPIHGWRELLKEVGIIVLGVLIALGAEQAAEAVHWAQEVRAERAALHAEIAANLDGMAEREEQAACVRRRLADLDVVFARHKARRPLGLLGPVGHPVEALNARGSWEIALAGQALAHMPLQEKLALSQAFSMFPMVEALQLQESQAWLRLAKLDRADLLEDGDWPGLRDAYNEARVLNTRMDRVAPYDMRVANAGVKRNGRNLKDVLLGPDDRILCAPLVSR